MESYRSPRGRDRDDLSADNHRERRSSPARRDRRRSRSPNGIDRYQPDRAPRDDYRSRNHDTGRRERRRSPHDRIDRNPAAIDRYIPGQEALPATNPMHNPLKLTYQVGFTYYAEWWRFEQRVQEERELARTGRPPRIRGEREAREERAFERAKIQAAYDAYKIDFLKLQAQDFVRQHRNEAWFREKYSSELRNAIRPRILEPRKTAYAQFEQDLAAGTFDEFTLEGIYKQEANGQGGIVEKEEGEAAAATEVLQTGDLVPARGGDLRDPAAQQPTLLVKTVAPTVTRESLENLARSKLGDGPGGFRFLSLSDPNSGKRFHRIGWFLVNDDPDAIVPDAEETEEGEHDSKQPVQGSAQATAASVLPKVTGQTTEDGDNGGFTIHCGIHRPPDAPRKKALWDLFSAPERIERDLDLATRLARRYDNELGEKIFGTARIVARVNHLHESGQLRQVIETKPTQAMDEDIEGGEIEEAGQIDDDEHDDEELLVRKKQLDLLVEYLRRVHNFCFFCVFESDSVHELQRKCPGGHLRRPRASLTSAAKEVAKASTSGEEFPLKRDNRQNQKPADQEDGDVDMAEPESPNEREKFARPAGKSYEQLNRAWSWVKTYEQKLLQILEPENIDLVKIGGTPADTGLEEELLKYVKQEDVSKYRCKAPDCTKLFKGTDFWRKHVESRHSDFFATIKQDIELMNAYVMDPAHIAPSRSDANSNGHFPANNNAITGTPRNYAYSGQPAIIAMQGVFAQGGYNNASGPVRSQTGRFGNGHRSSGPYGRPEGRNGRLPSFSGRSGGSLEGGAASMGPVQATQGRTMRSYEDLDAAGPAKIVEELDY